MPKLGPSAFVWLPFDAQGGIRQDWAEQNAAAELQAAVSVAGVTDLVVIAHGWQNDLPVAEALYGTLWGNVCAALVGKDINPDRIVVAGVLWPAKKYDADYDGAHALDVQSEARATLDLDSADGGLPQHVDIATFEAGLATLIDFVGAEDVAPVLAAARTAAEAPDSDAAEALFATAKAALDWDVPAAAPDPELAEDAARFARTDEDDRALQLLSLFSGPLAMQIDPAAGSALGLGDVVRSSWQGARNGVLWILNKLTYYTMKKRAGVVGTALARDVLDSLQVPQGLRIHLVGHSFGGRLVTATTSAITVPTGAELASVVLLQAAYSHNGLATTGPFAAMVGKPTGPIVITHTHNDLACTIAYPLASRVVGETTKMLGDAQDPFGAMGANGPQKLPPDVIVACDPTTLPLRAGVINTVLADKFIVKTEASDAHNNVTNAKCGAVVAAALYCS